MLRVGLTGGIGCGKSTVAKVFTILDIPVYDADKEAKRLMNEDPELKAAIRKNFGEESYAGEQLNRSYLASVVFSQPRKLEILNSLVHPATMKDGEAWMMNLAIHKNPPPYAIHEAALVFEADVAKRLDKVIGVFAPMPVRIKRIMARDQITEDEVLKRMSRQMEEESKMKLCDFVITNDEQQLLIPQVLALHENFLKTSQ